MKRVLSLCLMGLIAGMFQVGCDDADDTDDTGNIVFVNPNGGETFEIGDTVELKFKANGDIVSSVGVLISSDNGNSFSDILSESVEISGSGMQTATVQWIVGSESGNESQLYQNLQFANGADPSWKCRIRIFDYIDPNIDEVSDAFKVTLEDGYALRYPVGGEEYNHTDSIPVIYMIRTDKMSVIQRHFWSLEINDWVQFLSIFGKQSQGNWECKTYEYYLNPSDPSLLGVVGDSTKIMINDYSTPNPRESGWIKITK